MGAPSSATLTGAPMALQLQRLAGNSAMASLLGPQAAGDRAASTGLAAPLAVQRKKGDASDAKTTTDIAKETAKYVGNFPVPRSTDAPTGYRVTVAVSMDVPEYLTFAKTRMKSTIRNKIRGIARNLPGASSVVRRPKTSGEIKNKAAVKAAGKAPGTPATDPAVDNILQNSDAVGHSWIKLSPVAASGPVQTYSFGFIPANGAQHGPQQSVPGYVRNPDLEFEATGNNLYLDTTVDAKAYLKALNKVTQLSDNPPDYMTIGYNCTQFTKEIARVAGASFPHKAGMMIPISDRGFMQRALSPNALYSKLEGKGATDTSPERDLLQDPGNDWGGNGIQGPARPRGLQLFDAFDDDGTPFDVDPDEMIIPLGQAFGQQKVLYGDRELFVTSVDALMRHLEQQVPTARSTHRLAGSLSATGLTSGQARTIASGTQIMVTDADRDEVTFETPRPDAFRGTCDLLAFWKAVGDL